MVARRYPKKRRRRIVSSSLMVAAGKSLSNSGFCAGVQIANFARSGLLMPVLLMLAFAVYYFYFR
jgi:hypothetical protein